VENKLRGYDTKKENFGKQPSKVVGLGRKRREIGQIG